MKKTILVPLDGSERAETILPYVMDLASCVDADVLLLRVLEPDYNPVDPYGPSPQYYFELREAWRAEIETYLKAVTERLAQAGVNVRSLVQSGPVVSAILETARQEDVYLIAMASHGRSGLARVFYGSIAAGVLHQVDRPLLLVRTTGE